MFRSMFSTGTARKLARRRQQLQKHAESSGVQHLVRHIGALKGRTALYHYPRDLLYSSAVLRRKHYARAQPHQQRRSTGSVPDDIRDIPDISSVLALPLCHRPLLPGMTIDLRLPPLLYNKILTEAVTHDDGESVIATFLVNVSAHSTPMQIGTQTLPALSEDEPTPVNLYASQFVDLPHLDDIHHIGTLCRVMRLSRDRHVVLESLYPIEADRLTDKSRLTISAFSRLDIADDDDGIVEELRGELLEVAQQLVDDGSRYAEQLRLVIDIAKESYDLGTLVNQVISLCTNIDPLDEQKLLSERSACERTRRFLEILER